MIALLRWFAITTLSAVLMAVLAVATVMAFRASTGVGLSPDMALLIGWLAGSFLLAVLLDFITSEGGRS